MTMQLQVHDHAMNASCRASGKDASGELENMWWMRDIKRQQW